MEPILEVLVGKTLELSVLELMEVSPSATGEKCRESFLNTIAVLTSRGACMNDAIAE